MKASNQLMSTPQFCPLCAKKGKNTKILPFFTSLSEGINMCSSVKCTYPFGEYIIEPVTLPSHEEQARIIDDIFEENKGVSNEDIISSVENKIIENCGENNISFTDLDDSFILHQLNQHIDSEISKFPNTNDFVESETLACDSEHLLANSIDEIDITTEFQSENSVEPPNSGYLSMRKKRKIIKASDILPIRNVSYLTPGGEPEFLDKITLQYCEENSIILGLIKPALHTSPEVCDTILENPDDISTQKNNTTSTFNNETPTQNMTQPIAETIEPLETADKLKKGDIVAIKNVIEPNESTKEAMKSVIESNANSIESMEIVIESNAKATEPMENVILSNIKAIEPKENVIESNVNSIDSMDKGIESNTKAIEPIENVFESNVNAIEPIEKFIVINPVEPYSISYVVKPTGEELQSVANVDESNEGVQSVEKIVQSNKKVQLKKKIFPSNEKVSLAINTIKIKQENSLKRKQNSPNVSNLNVETEESDSDLEIIEVPKIVTYKRNKKNEANLKLLSLSSRHTVKRISPRSMPTRFL